jgi:Acyltransferase family
VTAPLRSGQAVAAPGPLPAARVAVEAGAHPQPARATSQEHGPATRRPRLDHVDAMRPVKQFGVVLGHAVAFFPPSAALAGGTTLLFAHVTRFAFMFISAAMLVYAYPELDRRGLRVFWRRRLLAIGLPYVTWTLVYFGMESGSLTSPLQAIGRFGYFLATGYYQLYFLLLYLELCLVFPLFLWLLRRTERHHWALFVSSLALQLVLTGIIYWHLQPRWALGSGGGLLELWNYQLYVVVGGLLAWHYREVHGWLCRHWRLVVAATAASAVLAEVFYVFVTNHPHGLLAGTDPLSAAFQPVVVPVFLGMIACVYLLGVAMVHPRRSSSLRSVVQAGSDNSYGIYLSQVLLFNGLVLLGWGRLGGVLPWPVVTYGSAVVVFGAAAALTAILARLPGARALAGRPRQPWHTLFPWARRPTASLARGV